MIANVSPSIATFDDTYNTLKYANRAKNIKTQVTRNVTNAQYHISNYNQIISNLRSEINELKSQLGKKDPNVNINLIQEKNFFMQNPSKAESKKEDNKENKNNIFEKAIKELKGHLQEELLIHNKINEQEKEISKAQNLLNLQNQPNEEFMVSKKQRYSSKTLVNLNTKNDANITEIEDTQRIQTEPNKEDQTSDKENININNNNFQKEKFINLLDQNNSIQTELESDLNTINNTCLDKDIILTKLKKSYERNSIKFAELLQKREIMLNIYQKNGIKDYQYEYLRSLIKSQNLKFYINEFKEKDKFNCNLLDVKEDYINLLENQVKIRDDVIIKNNLDIVFEENDEIKTLDYIKKEYANKLPPIIARNKSNVNISGLVNRKSIENNEIDKNYSGYYYIFKNIY